MAQVKRIELTCPDGVIRIFDSQAEVEFIEYCVECGIKIIEYNTDKHKKFEICPKPPEGLYLRKFEKKMMKSGFLFDCKKMRNHEHIMQTYDFHIELEGVECLCEIKGEFSNRDTFTIGQKEEYTVWALKKTLSAQVIGMPILVFIGTKKKYGYEWRMEYFIPESYKEKFTEYK